MNKRDRLSVARYSMYNTSRYRELSMFSEY